MMPKTLTALSSLYDWMNSSCFKLCRMERELRSASESLPSGYPEIHAAVIRCQAGIEELSVKLNASLEEAYKRMCRDSLSDTDIQQLLVLNRQLRNIDPFLQSVANDVRPRMEGKLADPNDPMYDYEIEARIDFILREDDPEYSEDDDNILTTRDESLKSPECPWPDEPRGYGNHGSSSGVWAEPHCWRFHDLYDHAYGFESPCLSFRDCLRVGKIFIDVQIWQQYSFDIGAELPQNRLTVSVMP